MLIAHSKNTAFFKHAQNRQTSVIRCTQAHGQYTAHHVTAELVTGSGNASVCWHVAQVHGCQVSAEAEAPGGPCPMNAAEQVTLAEVLNACFVWKAVSLLGQAWPDLLRQSVGIY